MRRQAWEGLIFGARFCPDSDWNAGTPSFNLVKNLQLKDKAIRRERCGSTLKLLPQQQIGPYEESSMWHELDLPRRPAD